MLKLFKITGLVLTGIFLFSCQPQQGSELKEISKKEKALKAKRQDVNLASALDHDYKKFFEKHPNDTIIPHILFENAQININPLNKIDAAISEFETIYTKYPDSRYAMNSLFKAAYLNDKSRHFDKAKEEYLLYVKKYPNDEMASQARELAAMSGLSDEEQFKQVMTKRALIEDSIKNQKKVIK